jgi:hypothetical protein
MVTTKCDFGGCKCAAKWIARKLFGDGGTLRVCEKHKPDPDKRPASLRHLPFFYEVSAIARMT